VPDSEHADVVVAVTDNLTAYPLWPISIPQTRVDYVVAVDSIGDPQGIAFGTTALTRNPLDLKIARTVARVIEAAGLIRDGFSFQTGAGGASLASASFVRDMMLAKGVKGGFALGGITGYMVAMLEEGLFTSLIDVQGFDLEAVRSLARNPAHLEVGASFYASPFNAGCAVNQLDAVVLGATEIDVDFNVNVVTGSDGTIMGGSGGHGDAAAGAGLTVVAAKLARQRLPVILDRVRTVATPGESVDVLVTERGCAVNPLRADLADRFKAAGLPVESIEALRDKAMRLTGPPAPLAVDGPVVAVVEYRDGTVTDVVRRVC
jgi:citrate lyase subunit alpha / citrate CoA-transferase